VKLRSYNKEYNTPSFPGRLLQGLHWDVAWMRPRLNVLCLLRMRLQFNVLRLLRIPDALTVHLRIGRLRPWRHTWDTHHHAIGADSPTISWPRRPRTAGPF